MLQVITAQWIRYDYEKMTVWKNCKWVGKITRLRYSKSRGHWSGWHEGPAQTVCGDYSIFLPSRLTEKGATYLLIVLYFCLDMLIAFNTKSTKVFSFKDTQIVRHRLSKWLWTVCACKCFNWLQHLNGCSLLNICLDWIFLLCLSFHW